jgi:hypothetical protein
MERSRAFPLEVEERYLEVRTRYPQSDYARMADYRLARMPFLAGEYEQAARRYEFYLRHWQMEDSGSRSACRDLIFCYLRSGECERAVLLGEMMVPNLGHQDELWEALPALFQACSRAGMAKIGLGIVERSLDLANTRDQRDMLRLARIRFMTELRHYRDAKETLKELCGSATDSEVLAAACVARARLELAQMQPLSDLAGCRKVVQTAQSEQTRAEALELLGRYYESKRQFDDAAHAYAGMCPVSNQGGGQ